MSDEFYINLTLALYRVTGLFSEKEPLKCDIRKLANEILVGLLCNKPIGCIENIKQMDALLAAAKSQKLVDSRNFLVLRREYAKICQEKQELGTMPQVRQPVKQQAAKRKPGREKVFRKPNKRKEEIMGLLKDRGRVRISDLAQTFPGLNRRTLLRDLDGFCQVGLAMKSGNGRGACYTVKNATL